MLAGHSTIRTAVMGEAASQRKDATPEELAQMKAMVADAMANGAIGLGASYSLNHSGYGGVPMPSTIAPMSELDALVGAMGPRGQRRDRHRLGREDAAGAGADGRQVRPAVLPGHRRRDVQRAGARPRAQACSRPAPPRIRRGNGLYIQIPCQPLSFDFTMANAYPFYSHSAFDPIKAYTPEQLKAVFRDPSWRAKFRENAKNPRPGMIFQGNWDRVMVAVAHKPANAKYANRYARTRSPRPSIATRSTSCSTSRSTRISRPRSSAASSMSATTAWRGCLKHEAGVVALSDAGAHLIYMCDAGFGLHFLARWVRERGDFDLVEGVRRLTSHPADLYGIQNRGRIAVGAQADLLLFDPATVGVSPAERVADLPGGGRRTIRRPTGVHGVFCNGVMTFDGKDYVKHAKGPGQVLDRFNASRGGHNLAMAAQ